MIFAIAEINFLQSDNFYSLGHEVFLFIFIPSSTIGQCIATLSVSLFTIIQSSNAFYG